MIVKNKFLKMVVALIYHNDGGNGDRVCIEPLKTREVHGNILCEIDGRKLYKLIEEAELTLGDGSDEHKIPESGLLDVELGQGYHLLARYYGDKVAEQRVNELYK